MPLNDLLVAYVTGIDAQMNAIDDALTSNLHPSTVDQVAEHAAVKAASHVEDLFREVFYRCMLGASGQVGVAPVMVVANRGEVDHLIFQPGRRREKYLEWLPLDSTLNRATLLANAEPFDRLAHRPVEGRALDELTVVRNAVAHPGDYAAEQFREMCRNKKSLATRPAEYLLAAKQGTTEVQLLLTRLKVIGNGLCAASQKDADQLLEPEATFAEGQRCPVGKYECTACQQGMPLYQETKVRGCPVCRTQTECATCGHVAKNSPPWKRIFV